MDGPDTAGREHDEEEIWRDLVSRLDPGGQVPDEDSREDAPWPAAENVDVKSFGARVIKPADLDAVPPEPLPAVPGEPAAEVREDGDEHYVPPPPPPLPHLDPVTKGAWLALFGGPAYLLVATMAGWAIPGWGAFFGIAAFVGGFVTLVVRMSDEDRGGSDSDNGAVV